MAVIKAKIKVRLPSNKKDKSNKNPHLINENHDEEINAVILKMAEKFGVDTLVVSHFLDGTAISVADKAKKVNKDGNEAVPRIAWRKEDDYVWIGIRNPSSTGTVE
jgi:hypothetical protein